MQETPMERKLLVKWSIKRLKEQATDITQDIERDCSFIEEKTQRLPSLSSTKQTVEGQIAERKTRVENLRITLQMIELAIELFLAEQKRLGASHRKQPEGLVK